MATLKPKHKEFIVRSLACMDSPSKVQQELKAVYGVEATLSQISYYDPNNRQSRGLARKWKRLFEETRKAFLESVKDLAVAQKVYRLRMLDKIAREAERRGDYMLALKALEQAAREMGGVYTAHRVLGGRLLMSQDTYESALRRIDGERPGVTFELHRRPAVSRDEWSQRAEDRRRRYLEPNAAA